MRSSLGSTLRFSLRVGRDETKSTRRAEVARVRTIIFVQLGAMANSLPPGFEPPFSMRADRDETNSTRNAEVPGVRTLNFVQPAAATKRTPSRSGSNHHFRAALRRDEANSILMFESSFSDRSDFVTKRTAPVAGFRKIVGFHRRLILQSKQK